MEDTAKHPTVGDDAAEFLCDAGRIFTAPLRFHDSDWLTTGCVLGATALLFTIDEKGRTIARRNQSDRADDFFVIGERYGQYEYGIGISGGLYLGGLIFNSRDVRETGVMLLESIAFSGAITTIIKVAAGRSRPMAEEGSGHFHPFDFRDIYNSLPSGHATVAMSISTVLAERLKNTWATVGLYSLAAITVGSRIYHQDHWISDTFLGAAIGMSVGVAVNRLHEENGPQASLQIMPIPGGLRAELRF